MKRSLFIAAAIILSLGAGTAVLQAKSLLNPHDEGILHGVRCLACKGSGFNGNLNCPVCKGTGRFGSY